ncbi:MAG: hypothetical protein QOH54_1265 [Mycobacterium sp.]|jgi:hypothetical protein|nr:hypothetical protein [Mycobacterium sp.]
MGNLYRSKWDPIIDAARDIAESYDTAVTLRQLFYRLVAGEFILNSDSSYTTLSKLTAEGRRDGTFPELIDTTREIVEPVFFDSPADAINYVASFYRRDRLADAPVSVYLGVEKRGLIAQLDSWFGDPYGIPILPLGGMTSQSFINVVKADAARRERVYGRKAVLLYAGDFDASGVAIDRVFNERTAGSFAEVRRVALNPGQVNEFSLVRQRGKPNDNNVDAFLERYGKDAWFEPLYATNRAGETRWMPVQVEMDALDPNDLRQLFADAIAEFVDLSEISDRAGEDDDREQLAVLADLADRFTVEQLRAIDVG